MPPTAPPQGLAALAAWWEATEGASQEVAADRGPWVSRLPEPTQPARGPRARSVASDAGSADDGALLALDRFTAALEQVLISEAASHGIEVQR